MNKKLLSIALIFLASCSQVNSKFTKSEQQYLNYLKSELKNNIFNGLPEEDKLILGKRACDRLVNGESIDEILKDSKKFTTLTFTRDSIGLRLFDYYSASTLTAPSTLCPENIKSLNDYKKLLNENK